jgi:PPP family 3-phenylpropionic acid transporter
VVLPFLGPYLNARGVTAVGIGCITAAFSLAKLVYAPFLGAWVDRGHWRRGLLTVHALAAVGCAGLLGTVDGAWPLGVLLFGVGLGYGTVLPLVEATVLERLPAAGYGSLRVWGSVGFVVVAVLSPRVLEGAGMSWFPVVVVAILAALAVSCLPFENLAHSPRPARRDPLPALLWALLALLTLHQLAHGPYYAFFSVHLEAAGHGSTTIGAMWSVGVLAEMAAFLAGARIEARFSHRTLLGAALLLSPLRWLLLALPPTLPVLLAAQIGHAATFAAAHLAGVQLVQKVAPAGTARYAQALYSGLCFGLGVVAGSALAGPVYAAVGGSGSFLAAAGVSAVLFVAWLPLGRALRRAVG